MSTAIQSQVLKLNASGQFDLNEAGENRAFITALQKLLLAFLKRFKSIGDKQRTARLKAADDYITTKITSVDVFFDHINPLATTIGVKEELLQQFIGNHFNNLLEKCKNELKVVELEKIKILQNPNATISDELLLEMGGRVLPEGQPSPFTNDGTILNQPGPGSAEAVVEEVVDKSLAEHKANEKLPSAEMLEYVGALFERLGVVPPPIILPKGQENSHLPADMAATIAAQMPADDNDDNAPSLPVAPVSQDPPSVEMLAQVGQVLQLGDALERMIESARAPAAGSDEESAPVPVQISQEAIEAQLQQAKQGDLLNFPDYYALLQKLMAFQKNPDKNAYARWANAEATEKEKGVLTLRNQLARQKAGTAVDWASVQSKLAGSMGASPDQIAGLKEDIRQFEQARMQMMRLQKRVIDFCAKARVDARPHLSALQKDLVLIFDKKDSLTSKHRALKMALLKVGQAKIAKVIEQAAMQELKVLAGLYGLEE